MPVGIHIIWNQLLTPPLNNHVTLEALLYVCVSISSVKSGKSGLFWMLKKYLAWNKIGVIVSACQMLLSLTSSSSNQDSGAPLCVSQFFYEKVIISELLLAKKKEKEKCRNSCLGREKQTQEMQTGESLHFWAWRDKFGSNFTSEEVGREVGCPWASF